MPDLLTPIQRERLYGLTFRSLTPADQARYTPLELIPGRDYSEKFMLDGAGPSPDEAEWMAVLLGPGSKVIATQPVSMDGNTLQLDLESSQTVRLFASCKRGAEIGEWYIFPGPLATGPVSFKKPPTGRGPAMWFCIEPFPPNMEVWESTLQGINRGDWSDTESYSVGDIVAYGGHYWYSLCENPTVPVWEGPDANALPTEFAPVEADDATALDAGTAP